MSDAPLTPPPAEPTKALYRDTWDEPSAFPGRLAGVNSTLIGVQYVVTSLTFFLIGGFFALLIRVQLAVPENTFLGPDAYNRLFTMHGTTMMYLFAVPFMEGLAALLLPYILGTRNLAYPRLTAFSYWTFLFSGLIFFSGFLFDRIADVGWFAYTPLSAPRFAEKGIDFWLVGLGIAELAGIAAGAQLMISVLRLRAPGMTLDRLPLYGWAWLVVGMMIVLAFTTLLVATLLLELDQALGTQFFNDQAGGNHLLWQHLFWFFGHPEVYIIFLPATGIVSMIVAAFARRLSGYTLIVVAILVTGFLSFGLWVHHMYTTGLPELSLYFFAGASLVIAIASGTQIFAWIGSLWGTRPRLETPLLYVLGFVFTFVLGGLTGVMVAVVPFDWQVHDTFFLVAHFHYVLIGGAVFPMLAGLHYWFPKLTGRMPSEFWGKTSFWLSFVGFHVAFFPMHIMGLLGMPRRVYTYPEELHIGGYNLAATIGSFVLAAGLVVFVGNLLWAMRSGRRAPDNPWGSDSLEWSFSSPPPLALYPRLPVVTSRHPLWQRDEEPSPGQQDAERIVALLDHRPVEWRAVLVVHPVTAEPQALARNAGVSYMPLVTAVGVALMAIATIGKLFVLVPVGALVSTAALLAWLWPRRRELEQMRDSPIAAETGLPVFTTGTRSLGWMGLMLLLIVLAVVYLTLFYSYFYIRLYSPAWPQDDLPRPERVWPAIVHGLLPLAALALAWTWRAFRQGGLRGYQVGLAVSCVVITAFLTGHIYSQTQLPFTPQTNAYGSLFFVLSWVLDLTALVGLGIAGTALVRALQKDADWRLFQALHAQMAAHYGYFLGVVSVLVFVVLYLSPYVV